MCKKNVLIGLLLVMFLPVSSATVSAGVLFYDSFEEPVVPDIHPTGSNQWVISGFNSNGPWPGWVGGGARYTGILNKAVNVAGSELFVNSFGDQVAFIFSGPTEDTSANLTTTSDSLDAVLTADAVYTLTFNTASASGAAADYHVELLAIIDNEDPALAVETILDSATGSLTSNDLSANSDSIVFVATAGHANLGERVAIRLRKGDGYYENNVYYDNVQLTAVAELASFPNPADEAVDVLRDVTLTWNPGKFAVKHDIYFGTEFEDVNTATVPTNSGLDVNSFDPGRLDLGKTYFWRVDEVNEAPDYTVFKGDVWSFKVEPTSIPIPGEAITVSATSMMAADENPNNLINGSGLVEVEDRLGHSVSTKDMWRSTATDPAPAITFVLDRLYKLHQIHVWNHNSGSEKIVGFGMKEALVEYSVDGETWMELGIVTIPQANGYSNDLGADVDLGDILAQQVRLTTVANYSAYGLLQVGLAEVQFMMIPTFAREPQPADGDLIDGVQIELAWRAGREAASHDIYLGTNANDLTFVDTTTETSYSASFDLASTYYWLVDEVNDAEIPITWQGDIWSFSTREYLVVDDFESYDSAENRIWYAWKDGLGYGAQDVPPYYAGNGTGSVVGVENTKSYTEEIIVHSGKQSMPFFYRNTLGTTYSEGTHTFADPQDWTASGIKTLALAFHGKLGNTGKFYVKINNTKVTYDLDASHIAVAQWQAWNIDLSLVNASLQSVTDLTIGVEGAGAIGTLYIDDIRLYSKAGELTTPVDPGAENLVAAWNFDEGSGTVATDSSGNGHNGTIVDATWETGKQGSDLLFNGVSSYVNIDGFKGINAVDGVQQAFTIAK